MVHIGAWIRFNGLIGDCQGYHGIAPKVLMDRVVYVIYYGLMQFMNINITSKPAYMITHWKTSLIGIIIHAASI